MCTEPTSSVDPIGTGGHGIPCLQARPLTCAFVTRQRVDIEDDGSSPTRILPSAVPSSPSAAPWSNTTSVSPAAVTLGVGWNHGAGGGQGERACGRHARVLRRSRAGRGRRTPRRTPCALVTASASRSFRVAALATTVLPDASRGRTPGSTRSSPTTTTWPNVPDR